MSGLPEPYYRDDAVTLYHADCRDVLPGLVAGSVDAVVTDPPYGVGFDGKTAKQRDGSVKIIAGGYGFDDTPEYIRDVVVPVIDACRAIAHAVVVTPGTRAMWLYPEPDDVGCWFSAAGTGLSSWGFRCSQPIFYYGRDPYLAAGQGARPNSVGQVWPNDANGTGHPCAKPLRLVRWLVGRASLHGQTILDPFAGSGTTARAAKDLGRRCIAIERERAYCDLIVSRLAQSVLPLEVPA